jgi:hypothetical protein
LPGVLGKDPAKTAMFADQQPLQGHSEATTVQKRPNAHADSRWVVLLLAPDAILDDVPPAFAEHGNIPLSVNGIELPSELLVAQLRVDGDSQRWVVVGVLRDVSPKADGNLSFSRWESSASGVDLGPPNSVPTVDQHIALASWPTAAVDQAMKATGKLWFSASRAREFAQYLAWAFTGTVLLRKNAARALREHAPAHHLFHRQVKFWLSEFLGEHYHDATPFQLDTDGLLREGTTRSRYTLLGSYVQPETSIVSPFRCAIDYTVQTDPTSGLEVRQGLLSSWAHVASGSFDAAVRVVILRSDTPYEIHSHLSLRHVGTRNLLERLKQAGVFMALLGPDQEDEG